MFDFDRERAKEVLGIIYEAYTRRTYLFKWVHTSNGDAPQHRYIPDGVKRGSLEHRQFLFFCSLITYSGQSEQGIKQCFEVHRLYPGLFDKDIINISIEELERIFAHSGFIYPNAIAGRWRGSGITLFKRYDGDPLKIFIGKDSVDEVLSSEKREKGRNLLPGFGPKILSLLALWYEELDLVFLRDAFPCDVHVQNQCLGLGIAKSTEKRFRTTDFAEFLRRETSVVCEEQEFKPLLLSHAMWFLGNRVCVLCRKKRNRAKFLCPVFAFCSGRVSTKLYRRKGEWDLTTPKQELPLFSDF